MTTTVEDASSSLDENCSCNKTTILLTILITIIILFKIRNPLQYYIKFTIYVLTVMAFSISIIPITLFRPRNTKNVDTVAKVLSFLFKIFEIEFQIEDAKYFQLNQPYIIICNHQSSLDFMTMMKIWPAGNCTPLAKKELLYSGPFGLAIWLCGITFIDRLNPQKARGTIDELAKTINDNNMRVWIYPEGTRSAKTELLPFKKGAFHLAIQAQIPIVCVVTSSYLNFYSKKEKKFLPGLVKVKVLPPFQTHGMNLDSVNQLTKHLQDKMQKEFDLLNKQINLNEKYLATKNRNDLENDNDKIQDLTCANSIQEIDLQEYETNFSSLINQTDLNTQIQNDSNNNSINEDESKKIN